MSVVIQIDGVSKQYRLGEVSTGSLGHDLNRWWHRVRGKEDPYLTVTGENVRTRRREAKAEKLKRGKSEISASQPFSVSAFSSDYVWALRDINLEVAQGEVLGIIGRNGAGKSTLLKILSRVTAPTVGEIRVKGRIASLLEVGTGFHQDLTGRENIFLNGAILGMTKPEIQSKLDDIVDFSGCAAYLDTPVKRYSSGMVVRLGFAVAAHLEPEILIVDEVLAVGDLEFQAKCIGKMSEVASQGRTVLFVSHNLAAVQNLCQSAIWLDNGTVKHDKDEVVKVVAAYEHASRTGSGAIMFRPDQHRVRSGLQINAMELLDREGRSTITFKYGESIHLRFHVHSDEALSDIQLGFSIRANGLVVTSFHSPVFNVKEGQDITLDAEIPGGAFLPGMFDVDVGLAHGAKNVGLDFIRDGAVLFVSDVGVNSEWIYSRRMAGIVRLPVKWNETAARS